MKHIETHTQITPLVLDVFGIFWQRYLFLQKATALVQYILHKRVNFLDVLQACPVVLPTSHIRTIRLPQHRNSLANTGQHWAKAIDKAHGHCTS